jgi:hypothetical protein
MKWNKKKDTFELTRKELEDMVYNPKLVKKYLKRKDLVI